MGQKQAEKKEIKTKSNSNQDQYSRFPLTITAPEKSIFTPDDLTNLNPEKDLGKPGEFPYTTGIHKDMYMGKVWTMRMFSGFGTAKQTNERFKFLLKQGQTGLSIAFDMPALMGYDSDHPRSKGEVGKEGVAVCTLDDALVLFNGIPLDQVSTSMTINSTAIIMLCLYAAVAKQQGVPLGKLRGTIQNDILKEYIAQKEFIFPPVPSMRLITDMMKFCKDHMQQWNTISISGYHIREAGSTAVQELAYTLMDGFTYVEFGIKAGMNVDDFAPRLSFFFNSHLNFFEEIAKFRAARRIWAKRLRYKYGAKSQKSWTLRFHTQTAGCSLTAQQPMNNLMRTSVEALAAVLGGTQSLHTNSLDEALALPSEFAVTLALRTQQILEEESGLTKFIDPCGGAHYIEYLTNKMEEEAEKIFNEIETRGGMISAIEEGYPQSEIARASYEFQKAVDDKRYIVVGVNEFTEQDKLDIPILRIDKNVEPEQIKRVKEFKNKRDNLLVRSKLDNIREAAKNESINLMPLILDAVESHVTLGEIIEELKKVFGTWKEPSINL
ncbi:MAG: methylmalonyl-CoA mutase [Planctomycetes bacterium]|nr:methylmalonyl-CoA mutase [Planctomycetota bacterium]